MGKSTISVAIFNSYVKLPEGSWKQEFLNHIAPWEVYPTVYPTFKSFA